MKKPSVSQLFLTLLPLLITVFSLYLIFSPKKQAPFLSKEKTWAVLSSQLKKSTYRPNQILYGKVSTTHKSKLSASIESEVQQVLVKEGESVQKNQILIKLDPENYQYLLQQKQAEIRALIAQKKIELTNFEMDKKSLMHDKNLLALNQKSMERFKYLSKKNLSSKSQLDEAKKLLIQQLLSIKKRELSIANHSNKMAELKAKMSKAKAQLNQAKLDLDDSEIKAPFDGKITSVSVASGHHVNKQTLLITLYNLNEVYVTAQIPHKLWQVILRYVNDKQAQALYAVPVNYPSLHLPLERFASEVADENANINAFFKVPKRYATLVPLGMTVKLLLYLPPIKAFKIPASALYTHSSIYLIKNSRLKRIFVQRLGSVTEGKHYYLLVNNPQLSNGDSLLTTKLPNARTGLKVNIISVHTKVRS